MSQLAPRFHTLFQFWSDCCVFFITDWLLSVPLALITCVQEQWQVLPSWNWILKRFALMNIVMSLKMYLLTQIVWCDYVGLLIPLAYRVLQEIPVHHHHTLFFPPKTYCFWNPPLRISSYLLLSGQEYFLDLQIVWFSLRFEVQCRRLLVCLLVCLFVCLFVSRQTNKDLCPETALIRYQ